MPERPRQALEFGGGLDRSTGVMVVEETSFADLRNVYLYEGKAELRKGLYETITFFSDEEVIGIFAIRSYGIGVIVTYKAASNEVYLYRSNGSGTSTTGRFLIWTLDAGASFPRVNAADSYGKLYIAHDEEVFAVRQKSKVYDPSDDSISDYEQDLYQPSATPVPTYFRGFTRHLNYLVGWGYGTENSGDEDKPEILRVSLPGEPDTMLPQHYLIVGQPREPILSCQTVQKVLVVRKSADSFVMPGTDRSNFGIEPIDQLFGVVAAHMMVTVGDRNIFWSLDGPRISGVGPSTDLAIPLDLGGPTPDASLASFAQDYGFAVYDPAQREVWFVFGSFAYILHMKDEALRWSYRKFAVALGAGGLLYSGTSGPPSGGGGGGGGGGPAPTAFPTITDITAIENSGATVEWDNTGSLLGGELAEIWAYIPYIGAWELLKDNIAVAGATGSEDISGLTPGYTYPIAVRFKLVGVYTAGYTSSDPSLWPAVSRGEVTMPAASTAPTDFLIAGNCPAPSSPEFLLSWTNTAPSGDKTRIEYSNDGQATWIALDIQTVPSAGSADGSPEADKYYWFRIRHEDPTGTIVSEWVIGDGGPTPICL